MVELTDDEKKVVEAFKVLKAIAIDKLKDADAIAKASMMPKGKEAIFLLVLRKMEQRTFSTSLRTDRAARAGSISIESI